MSVERDSFKVDLRGKADLRTNHLYSRHRAHPRALVKNLAEHTTTQAAEM